MSASNRLRGTIILAVLALGACAQDGATGPSGLLSSSNAAADSLAAQAAPRNVSPGATGGILVTAFVDLHDFRKSAPIGVVISEEIGSRLTQAGFRVLEARLGSELTVTRKGDFMLSDKAREIASREFATTVLVGTYTVDADNAYVNARLVRATDNVTVGAYSFVVPVSRGMRALLSDDPAAAPGAISLGRLHLRR